MSVELPRSAVLRTLYRTAVYGSYAQVALGERMAEEEMRLHEELGLAYTSGSLSEWFYLVW